ncbi:hypothetical protein MXF09_23640 [Klebsiella aerogenes]|uniref:hypothetical protein n=1 Tax=Klebsiella aerogenes TaxID=548 RepID=UPI002DBEE3A1|nr:hypothetical protein [Klebsiella aerogenes]MEB5742690.1 hypothetical protein [Klebsiella aerogenes]HBV9912398.1 hypothetical protein [Klebsiella aerogenes]
MNDLSLPLLPAGVKKCRLSDMNRGWFVGDFVPSAHPTQGVEVAVQHFPAGYHAAPHAHRIATEVTLLLSGRAEMAGLSLESGDILTLSPGTISDFHALEACVTVVVKHPGVLNDKYLHTEGDVC